MRTDKSTCLRVIVAGVVVVEAGRIQALAGEEIVRSCRRMSPGVAWGGAWVPPEVFELILYGKGGGLPVHEYFQSSCFS